MRFLIDGMLGKLNRWMRMIGYETEYAKDSGDDELVNSARRSSSILLTSDEELYRRAITHGVDSFLISGKNETERLATLAHRYNLRLSIDPNLSKCPLCGSSIKQVSKADIEALVPPTTFKVYRSFWKCTNPTCAKIYWHGSHWKRIEQTLEAARELYDFEKK
ncbi:MAG TPA: Mut7-C RNAse domain-containing protein [Candidatus Bathyarchaeia archaeon]|nr:Mut7-C RNAse domain-containing protein [Candidatus Bathyarchaeia archaeon]